MKKPPDDENDELEDSFKAVKMTLNTICSNDLLKKRINEFVLNANKIMFESYCLANLHIIKLINQNKKIIIGVNFCPNNSMKIIQPNKNTTL